MDKENLMTNVTAYPDELLDDRKLNAHYANVINNRGLIYRGLDNNNNINLRCTIYDYLVST